MNKESSHKHLGLFRDEKLTYERHLDVKICKATKGIGVIKSPPLFPQRKKFPTKRL